jgi:hypothetical protein
MASASAPESELTAELVFYNYRNKSKQHGLVDWDGENIEFDDEELPEEDPWSNLTDDMQHNSLMLPSAYRCIQAMRWHSIN